MKRIFLIVLITTFFACKKDQQLPKTLLDFCGDSVVFVGDSQFAETGGGLVPPPRRYWQEYGKKESMVLNISIGGATSTRMADTFAHRKMFLHAKIIAWVGTNNNWSDDDVIRDLHRIVDGAPDFLILQVQSGNASDAWKGGPKYDHDLRLNNRIILEFGISHFVDVKSYLQTLSDGSDDDLEDIEHDVVPRSCLYDWQHGDLIHKNNKGHEGVIQSIMQHLKNCSAP